jgi:hypothetical protein
VTVYLLPLLAVLAVAVLLFVTRNRPNDDDDRRLW